MEFFISSAFAQSGGEAGGGLLGLLPLVLIFVLFYFLLIRPQQKRTKKHKEMVESLQIGDEVVTNGGTLGVIANLDANFIGLEVADRVCIQVQRHAVAQLMPEGSFKRWIRQSVEIEIQVRRQEKAAKAIGRVAILIRLRNSC